MNIIDEIREEARRYDPNSQHARSFNRIADRLEQSGALVPVPEGEPCYMREISLGQCFLFGLDAFRLYSFSQGEFRAWQLSDHSDHLFEIPTIVQPVRLVPLKEWDAE